MSVEVKELVVRATVTENSRSCCDDSGEGETGENNSGSDAIIDACVRKVLKILRKANYR